MEPEEYAQAARKAMADGFTAVKVDPIGFDPHGVWMGWSSRGILQKEQLKLAVARGAALREAVRMREKEEAVMTSVGLPRGESYVMTDDR